MTDFVQGDEVIWTGGDGQEVRGRVQAVERGTMTRTVDGLEVTREGSEADPALYIDVDDGRHSVRLGSEVRRTE